MTHFQIYHPYRWILKPLNEIRQNLEKTQKIIKNKSENSAFLLREDWESLKEILKMGSTRNARLTWSFRGPRNIEVRDPWTYPETSLPWGHRDPRAVQGFRIEANEKSYQMRHDDFWDRRRMTLNDVENSFRNSKNKRKKRFQSLRRVSPVLEKRFESGLRGTSTSSPSQYFLKFDLNMMI